MERNFIEENGDPSWLVFGLIIVPTKIKKLSILNSLLASQPWNIKKENFTVLLNKYSSNNCNNSDWTNSTELLNAILILLFYQKMSIIVNNLGLEISTENLVENDSKNQISEKLLQRINYLKKTIKEIKLYPDKDQLEESISNIEEKSNNNFRVSVTEEIECISEVAKEEYEGKLKLIF